MSDEEDGEFFKIHCALGNLRMTVEGADQEWVNETFADEWAQRLEEAGEMSEAIKQGTRQHQ